jgi:hypothetical protein
VRVGQCVCGDFPDGSDARVLYDANLATLTAAKTGPDAYAKQRMLVRTNILLGADIVVCTLSAAGSPQVVEVSVTIVISCSLTAVSSYRCNAVLLFADVIATDLCTVCLT